MTSLIRRNNENYKKGGKCVKGCNEIGNGLCNRIEKKENYKKKGKCIKGCIEICNRQCTIKKY